MNGKRSNHGTKKLRSTAVGLVFAMFAMMIALASPAAAQTTTTLGSSTCANIFGTWQGSTCTVENDPDGVSTVTFNSGAILEIPSGVTLHLIGISLTFNGSARMINHGAITMEVWLVGSSGRGSRITTNDTSVVINSGTIDSTGSQQPISVTDSSTLVNSSTGVITASGDIFARNMATMNNRGTINANYLGWLNSSTGFNTGTIGGRFTRYVSDQTVVNDCDGVITAAPVGPAIPDSGGCLNPAGDPAECAQSTTSTVGQVSCFVDVTTDNIDDTPTAALDDLGELRTRVVYLKLQLARARSAVVQTKTLRMSLMPAEYTNASESLVVLRAQVQMIRATLATSRADVQAARPQ